MTTECQGSSYSLWLFLSFLTPFSIFYIIDLTTIHKLFWIHFDRKCVFTCVLKGDMSTNICPPLPQYTKTDIFLCSYSKYCRRLYSAYNVISIYKFDQHIYSISIMNHFVSQQKYDCRYVTATAGKFLISQGLHFILGFIILIKRIRWLFKE